VPSRESCSQYIGQMGKARATPDLAALIGLPRVPLMGSVQPDDPAVDPGANCAIGYPFGAFF